MIADQQKQLTTCLFVLLIVFYQLHLSSEVVMLGITVVLIIYLGYLSRIEDELRLEEITTTEDEEHRKLQDRFLRLVGRQLSDTLGFCPCRFLTQRPSIGSPVTQRGLS